MDSVLRNRIVAQHKSSAQDVEIAFMKAVKDPSGFCSLLSEMSVHEVGKFPEGNKRVFLAWVCSHVDVWEKPDGSFTASLIADENIEMPIKAFLLKDEQA